MDYTIKLTREQYNLIYSLLPKHGTNSTWLRYKDHLITVYKNVSKRGYPYYKAVVKRGKTKTNMRSMYDDWESSMWDAMAWVDKHF